MIRSFWAISSGSGAEHDLYLSVYSHSSVRRTKGYTNIDLVVIGGGCGVVRSKPSEAGPGHADGLRKRQLIHESNTAGKLRKLRFRCVFAS